MDHFYILVHTNSIIGVKRVIDVNELLTLLDVIGVKVISKSFDILSPVLCSVSLVLKALLTLTQRFTWEIFITWLTPLALVLTPLERLTLFV